jgi:LPXTG-motif cell wall-anchored protein
MAFAAEGAVDRASQQADVTGHVNNALVVFQPSLPRHQSAAWSRRAAAAAVVGVVLGGLLGLGVSRLGGSQVQASSAVLVAPDPPLLGDGQPVNSDTAQRFVQNEIQVLSSGELRSEVATRLGLRDVAPFQVTQVALTDVIQITVTAGGEGQARQIADTAATQYAADRQSGLSTRYTSAIGGVDQQAERLAGQLRTFPAATGPGQTQQLQAISAEYQQLLGQDAQLRLAAAQAAPLVQIVKQGAVTSTGGSSSTTVGLLAMVGALAGAGVAVWRRRRRRVIYSVRDLGQGGVQPATVLPNLAAMRWGAARRRRLAAADRAMRAHLSRLSALDGTVNPVVVVLPVGPRTGATFVARRLAASAAARRGAAIAEGRERAPGDEPGSRSVVRVVESPVLSSSGEAVRLARGADALVLVAGLGVSTYDEVQDVVVELAAAGVTPHGLVLNELPLRRPRGRSREPGLPGRDGPPPQRHPLPAAAASSPVRAER